MILSLWCVRVCLPAFVVRCVLADTYFCPGAMRTAWGTVGIWRFHSPSCLCSLPAHDEPGLLASCSCRVLCQNSACCRERPHPASEHMTVAVRCRKEVQEPGQGADSKEPPLGPPMARAAHSCYPFSVGFSFANWMGAK